VVNADPNWVTPFMRSPPKDLPRKSRVTSPSSAPTAPKAILSVGLTSPFTLPAPSKDKIPVAGFPSASVTVMSLTEPSSFSSQDRQRQLLLSTFSQLVRRVWAFPRES